MAEIRAPSGPVTQPGLFGLRRFRMAEIVEAAVIAILLIATAVFGFMWNQTASSLHSTQSTLSTTQSQLVTTRSELQSAQSDLATAQNTVTVRQQIDAYAAVYLKGTESINSALAAMGTAAQNDDIAGVQRAAGEMKVATDSLHAQMTSITVPSVLAAADQEFQQGLDVLVSGTNSLQQALNANDWNSALSALNTLDQGWSHMANGEDALLAVMSNPSVVL